MFKELKGFGLEEEDIRDILYDGDADSEDPGLSAGVIQVPRKGFQKEVVQAVPDLPGAGTEEDFDKDVDSVKPWPRIVNRKLGIGKDKIKSINEVEKLLEVKKLHPIKSIQEVKSIKEVKSLLKVPDEIAKRFIKVS